MVFLASSGRSDLVVVHWLACLFQVSPISLDGLGLLLFVCLRRKSSGFFSACTLGDASVSGPLLCWVAKGYEKVKIVEGLLQLADLPLLYPKVIDYGSII